MACSIEISEEYRDKYGLPKEMPEADFYAWLANGGLQALTNDNKLSFDGYKIVDNKFKESLGIAKTISDRVKLTIRKLNQMVYGAEAAGAPYGMADRVSGAEADGGSEFADVGAFDSHQHAACVAWATLQPRGLEGPLCPSAERWPVHAVRGRRDDPHRAQHVEAGKAGAYVASGNH